MKPEELWNEYCRKTGSDGSLKWQAWSFGGDPEGLLELVLEGKKTGTASLHMLYELDDSEPLPKEGDISIILDSRDRARCIIRTTKVYLKPFMEVTEDHARKEGEGDLTLAYWRNVHREFFSDCLSPYSMEFKDTMLVVCEEFQLVYRKKDKVLASACLLGENCKYSGGNNRNEKLLSYLSGKTVVPVCPEVLGGLPIPRVPAEIVDGVVMTKDGISVDKEFRNGAKIALETAVREDVDYAILQSRSPSCGVDERYDGTFSGVRIKGRGVFAELLVENGFRVIDVEHL